jgi:phospholipid/cholesterol/gamma-HCH transport system substrate-binding protein
LTANLDELVADVKPHLTESMSRMDSISAKLDSVLTQTNQLMASLNNGKGPVGALLNDEQMKTDVKTTVASLRKAADSAADTLGRINQFRVYWNYDWRYQNSIHTSRSDFGLKIVPREGRYYYLGVENVGNVSNAVRAGDYEKLNTVDALLGFDWKYLDLGAGVIRSSGGVRVTVTPFANNPLLGRWSVFGQGLDFGRNITVNGYHFTHPEYDFGTMVRLHRLIGVGARVEDVSEDKRFHTWVNVNFEDKDIAYLFGLATFGFAGTRARTKSSNSSSP